jgi:hypothetical protein
MEETSLFNGTETLLGKTSWSLGKFILMDYIIEFCYSVSFICLNLIVKNREISIER